MKESFRNRIEITSAGSLPDLLSQDEFFEGFSIPRNQEIMRIFKDLELVEHLGSGIPRILEAYPKECFKFTENFLRMTFPNEWDLSEDEMEIPVEIPVEAPVEAPVEVPVEVPVENFNTIKIQLNNTELTIVTILEVEENGSKDLLNKMGYKTKTGNFKKAINSLISKQIIEFTIPEIPKSKLQKYRLTQKGKDLQKLQKR